MTTVRLEPLATINEAWDEALARRVRQREEVLRTRPLPPEILEEVKQEQKRHLVWLLSGGG